MDIDDHPDLRDSAWIREANKRAKRDVRRMRRRARWRARTGKLVTAGALLVIAGVLFGMYQTGKVDRFAAEAAPTTLSTAPLMRVNLERPFLGTPAEAWAEGEAGVTAPAATPVGEFGAEQVAASYDQVRQVVIAARLDRALVEGHDPSRLISLFAPSDQDQLWPLFAGDKDPEAGSVATRVAPGQHLLAASPKVSGSMSAEAGRPGELVVHTNFAVAYAFEPDSPNRIVGPMDVVAVERFQRDYVLRTGDGFASPDRGLWLGASSGGHTFSIACTAARRGFLAPAFTERLTTSTGSTQEDLITQFDPARPMPTSDTCPK
jgi:hypothetical protein